MPTEEQVRAALSTVIDPEIGLDIVTLGLVYEINLLPDGKVEVVMTLTSRGCPLGPVITQGVQSAVGALSGVTEVDPQVVWEPAWSPECIEPAARKALMGR